MKKIILYVFLFLLTSSFSFAVSDLYAQDDINVLSINSFDNKLYILGNLSSKGITSFGFYDTILNTFTNRSSLYPSGSIIDPWLWSTETAPTEYSLLYDRGNHFKSSSYEILCYRYPSYSIHYAYCYKYNNALNKWVLILNLNGGGAISYYGQQHINGAINYYMYNTLDFGATRYTYNMSSGSLFSQSGTSGIILSQIDSTTSSRIKGLTNANTITYFPNSSGAIYYETTANSGLAGKILQDGWTDEENFYVLTTDDLLYKSIDDGVTFSQVFSSDCTDITNLPNARFADIACKDSTNCIIAVNYNETDKQIPLLVLFNGEQCIFENELDTLISSTSNTNLNRTINSIVYDIDNNKYYFGGKNILGFRSVPVFDGDSEAITTNDYIVQPKSWNFALKIGNNLILSPSRFDTEGGIIYTWPLDDKNYSTFEYNISSQNLSYTYLKTICNDEAYENQLLQSENFDSCTDTTDCGFFPSPSAYQWVTDTAYSGFGNSLMLYNETFSFGKYKYFGDVYEQAGYRILTTFDYFSTENTSMIFSIISPYNLDLVNIYIISNSSAICYNHLSDLTTVTGETLMFCQDYGFTTPISARIDYNNLMNTYIFTAETDLNIQSSETQLSNDEGYSMSAIKITSFITASGQWIDNINVYDIVNDETLTYTDLTAETSCQYEINSCYNTRIYTGITSTDYSTYKDFAVCSAPRNDSLVNKLEGNLEGSPYLPVDISLQDCNMGEIDCITEKMPIGTKLAFALSMILITVIAFFFMGSAVNMHQLGFQTGLILAFFELLIMAVPSFPIVGGFIPIWVIVTLIILIILTFSFSVIANFTKTGGQEGVQ